jgi:hypothetical protein
MPLVVLRDSSRNEKGESTMNAALLALALMLAHWPSIIAETPICPPTYFCSAAIGVYGPIIPYGDATGKEDVGPQIRSMTAFNEQTGKVWVMGHAWTQFWAITMLHEGDTVYANGIGYRVEDRTVRHACDLLWATESYPDLSMQTSLDSNVCGRVLVIKASKI